MTTGNTKETMANVASAAVGSDAKRSRAKLSLWDSTSIILGIILGSTIYEKAPGIATASISDVSRWWYAAEPQGRILSAGEQWALGLFAMLLVWLIGAIVALAGAFCYAELATNHTEHGGNYLFLRKAFGRWMGFAFAWAEFWIIRPGNVGAIAFVLASYAMRLLPIAESKTSTTLIAAVSIFLLTLLNSLGIQAGKATQNFLTAAKVVGLAAIVLVGLTSPWPTINPAAVNSLSPEGVDGITLALVFVMFAYGGWSDMSYVAAEVHDPKRNIARALVLGTLAVAVIYLLVNVAFFRTLGMEMLGSKNVAADVLGTRFGSVGSSFISGLICISCLGAIHGMVLTGSRVSFALGSEHPLLAWLGSWNEASSVPQRSLWIQGIVTMAMVLAFGLHDKGFDRLVCFTGPFFWGFFALVGLSLPVLRYQYPALQGYRSRVAWLVVPVFVGSSLLMTYSSLRYALTQLTWESIAWFVLVVVSGLMVAVIDASRARSAPVKVS